VICRTVFTISHTVSCLLSVETWETFYFLRYTSYRRRYVYNYEYIQSLFHALCFTLFCFNASW
jgi:hypothetical protein